MPMMVGFSAQRHDALRQEVERFASMMPTLGVDRVILVSDLSTGTVGPTTAIHLVVVRDTDLPFVRRADFFYSHLQPRMSMEVSVYTRDEFEEISESDGPAGRLIRQGNPIYG